MARPWRRRVPTAAALWSRHGRAFLIAGVLMFLIDQAASLERTALDNPHSRGISRGLGGCGASRKAPNQGSGEIRIGGITVRRSARPSHSFVGPLSRRDPAAGAGSVNVCRSESAKVPIQAVIIDGA